MTFSVFFTKVVLIQRKVLEKINIRIEHDREVFARFEKIQYNIRKFRIRGILNARLYQFVRQIQRT